MKFLNNLPPKHKSVLMKSLGVLTLIIIFFTVLSRVFFSGGETLTEYAESNPELALGDISAASTPQVESPETESSPPVPNSSENLTTETMPENTETMPTATPEVVSPERITYKNSFYYEPLSDELIAYITGVSYPAEGTDVISYNDLSYVHLLHYDFDGNVCEGEMICNNIIAQDIVEIFYDLYLAEYRIEKIKLIEIYNGNDNASMLDNNTSCFNYRPVEGSNTLSKHAYGLAIDINPFYNPYITYGKDGSVNVSPEGSENHTDRTQNFPYKIDTSDLCYQLFTEHGFIWGGNWNSCKDYQHFQKAAD